MFKVNGKGTALPYSYAFVSEVPDRDSFKPPRDEDIRPDGTFTMNVTNRRAVTIVLSDRPFDAVKMAGADRMTALQQMNQGGAFIVLATAGKGAELDSLVVAPGDGANGGEGETRGSKLELEPVKDGKLKGRLVVVGDAQRHKFDPAHWPLYEADLRFEAAAPR